MDNDRLSAAAMAGIGSESVQSVAAAAEVPFDAPLANQLVALGTKNRLSWHTPGHDGGRLLPAWLRDNLAAIDQTELPATGDINKPDGPALRAMELAAACHGAGCSRMITSGSTVSLQIMLALFCPRGSKLLLPRTSHQAVIHAAALLDLALCWIEPTVAPQVGDGDPYDLIPPLAAADVAFALARNPDCQVVLVTRPDYYGGCVDLPAIAEAVHQRGAVLLVDEAHGAHFAFAPGTLPDTALACGADACVQSGHKTLPVLTPGSWLHIAALPLAAGHASITDLDRLMKVFQTSSPSFAVAATLDYARAWMASCGREAILRQMALVKSHAQRWPQELRCSVLASRPTGTISRPTRDPLRLVIRRQTDQGALPARPLADYLGSRGIDIEFADLTRLVLIAHLDRPEADWRRLDDAFSDYYSSGADGLCTHAAARDSTCTAVGETAAGIGRLQSLAADLAQLEVVWREFLIRAPEMELKPGDMLFGKHRLELVSLNQAENRVSAAAVMPYPPGIPLLLPGERIDRARVEFLRQLSENKITISGIGQGCLWVLA